MRYRTTRTFLLSSTLIWKEHKNFLSSCYIWLCCFTNTCKSTHDHADVPTEQREERRRSFSRLLFNVKNNNQTEISFNVFVLYAIAEAENVAYDKKKYARNVFIIISVILAIFVMVFLLPFRFSFGCGLKGI